MSKVKQNLKAFKEFLIIGVIAGIMFFVYEHTYSPNNLFIRPYNLATFGVGAVIALSLINLYIWFNSAHKKLPILNKVVAIILGVLFLLNIINLFIMPRHQEVLYTALDGSEHLIEITRSLVDKTYSFGLLLMNLTLFYAVVVIVPQKPEYNKMFALTAIFFYLYLAWAITYSLVTEFDSYKYIIENGIESYKYNPTSLFDNRNTFGSFLLTGVIYSSYFYFKNKWKKRRYFFVFLGLIPGLFIYFTYSKTNIILFLVIYAIIIVRHYVRNILRKRWILFGIETVLISAILGVFFAFRYIPTLLVMPFGQILITYIPTNFIVISGPSVISRTKIWHSLLRFSFLDPRTIILGDGLYISRKVGYLVNIVEGNYTNPNSFTNFHNGFLEVFYTFGLVGFLLYLFFLLYLLVGIIRLFYHDKTIAGYLLIMFCVFLARGMVESQALMLFKSDPIYASIPIVTLTMYYTHKHKCGMFHPRLKKQKAQVEKLETN